MNIKKQKVLGYDVDLLTFNDAISLITNKIEHSKGLQIITINPEMIELANKNKEFSEILKNVDLTIPDGIGIKLALKLKGINQEQIPGIDLAFELINICNSKKYPISLIGAQEHTIEKTVKNLKTKFPELNICYFQNGYFSVEEEDKIINKLVQSKPKLVLAALGAPKQEFFIKKCRKFLPETVFIGVGGSFDVWAGEVKRAPELFRIAGCEWMYRTLKQPQRIKRIYKTLPLFLIKVIIEAINYKVNFVLKENK